MWARPSPDDAISPRSRRARRRTRSEDPCAAGDNDGFIHETLEEIRSSKRHSTSARLSDTEIDELLLALRRQAAAPNMALLLYRFNLRRVQIYFSALIPLNNFGSIL